jgi:archaellum component FlaC
MSDVREALETLREELELLEDRIENLREELDLVASERNYLEELFADIVGVSAWDVHSLSLADVLELQGKFGGVQ